MTDHLAIGQHFEFCATPGTPCKCNRPNNYRDCCKGLNWGQVPIGSSGTSKGPEAHHCLSVSEVNQLPSAAKKKAALLRVLAVTPWCINHKNNMIALPLWGHTILHYCTITKSVQDFKSRMPGPPAFKDLPMHDFEHNCTGGYCSEVGTDIEALWDEVAGAEKVHKKAPNGIKGRLDSLSKKWKKKLKDRATRDPLGSTHESWKDGKKKPGGDWFYCFSMASDAIAQKRSFPFTDEVDYKIDQIFQSMVAGGSL